MKVYKDMVRSIVTEDGGFDVRFLVDKSTLVEGDLVMFFDPLSEDKYKYQVLEVIINNFTGRLVLDNDCGQVDLDLFNGDLYEAYESDWHIKEDNGMSFRW